MRLVAPDCGIWKEEPGVLFKGCSALLSSLSDTPDELSALQLGRNKGTKQDIQILNFTVYLFPFSSLLNTRSNLSGDITTEEKTTVSC